MRSSLFIFFLFLGLSACSNKLNKTAEAPNLEKTLFALLQSSGENAKSNKLTSALMLSKLALSDGMLDKLLALNGQEQKTDIDQFLQSFLLAGQTQEKQHVDQFVKAYPEGEALKKINNLILDSDFKSVSSPFQEALANYAIDDDGALGKLVRSLKVLDGTNLVSIEEQLLSIHQYMPNRVEKAFSQSNLKMEEHLALPNTRSGKPTNAQVVQIVMENQGVLLAGQDWCDFGSPAFKTIGEYLSFYWDYHTETDGGNYLEISVKPGSNENVSDKHWEINLMVSKNYKEDVWGYGVIMEVLDKNHSYIEGSVKCPGSP